MAHHRFIDNITCPLRGMGGRRKKRQNMAGAGYYLQDCGSEVLCCNPMNEHEYGTHANVRPWMMPPFVRPAI